VLVAAWGVVAVVLLLVGLEGRKEDH
jgi:hypothetical protein